MIVKSNQLDLHLCSHFIPWSMILNIIFVYLLSHIYFFQNKDVVISSHFQVMFQLCIGHQVILHHRREFRAQTRDFRSNTGNPN